jgi:hypothetical protein
MRVVRCHGRCFDLKDKGVWDNYTDFYKLCLGQTGDLPELEVPALEVAGIEKILLKLRSEGFVMIGSDRPPIRDAGKPPDQSPYREKDIKWEDPGGALAESVVIPGSAIKGPLRHRTLFHFLRMNPQVDAHAAVDILFGTARDESNGRGGAGKVRVDDAAPPPDYDVLKNARVLPHVSIDRFSGGAYRSALFSAEALWRLPIEVRTQASLNGALRNGSPFRAG